MCERGTKKPSARPPSVGVPLSCPRSAQGLCPPVPGPWPPGPPGCVLVPRCRPAFPPCLSLPSNALGRERQDRRNGPKTWDKTPQLGRKPQGRHRPPDRHEPQPDRTAGGPSRRTAGTAEGTGRLEARRTGDQAAEPPVADRRPRSPTRGVGGRVAGEGRAGRPHGAGCGRCGEEHARGARWLPRGPC